MTDRKPLFELEIQPVVKGSRGAAHSLYQQLKATIRDGRLKPRGLGHRACPTASSID